jgi:hypothetical protein
MTYMGNLINLESVGTGLDKDGMTYPMLEGGGYDYGNGIHLDDIEPDGDWMQALNEADKIRISWIEESE